ncbi:MAG: O-methyltransferase [Firmicutes bacterium]|uniref:tRNA 5-hydroxyuridine methyltransferase n=1 Tax=Candidatus Scybalomonas excrementavium TaxID=2840943 RepID=A0A9D9N7J4_9FIRM|nr:O-methyltransferase [Candidatus Scybalomonas excrementavium]
MSKIVDERIVAYINSLNHNDRDIVAAIEKEAIENYVPIIRKETKELLKVLICMKKPQRVLEVGTAVGFSSIFMSEYLPEGATITTIENYAPRIIEAKKNFKRAGKEAQITLLEGDANDILKTLEPSYDMIFMDAAKGQYIHFFPEIMRLLSKDGLLISDNVLQDGDVVQSRYGVTRRNRTIHSRMREYLYTLKNIEDLETVILPVGDGVTVSTRIEKSHVEQ